MRIYSQGGAAVMSAPVVATGHFLLAVAGSRGWCASDVGDRCRCSCTTWVGTRAKLKP